MSVKKQGKHRNPKSESENVIKVTADMIKPVEPPKEEEKKPIIICCDMSEDFDVNIHAESALKKVDDFIKEKMPDEKNKIVCHFKKNGELVGEFYMRYGN